MSISVQRFFDGNRKALVGSLICNTTYEQAMRYPLQSRLEIVRNFPRGYVAAGVHNGHRYEMSFSTDSSISAACFILMGADNPEDIRYLMSNFLNATESREVEDAEALKRIERLHQNASINAVMHSRQQETARLN